MGGLRIVHAVRSDGFAGVESHVAHLAATQASLGHEVAVVGGEPAQMRRILAGAGVRHRPAATTFEVARAIDSWRRCDILHVHMTAAETAAVLAVRSWSVPVIATRHFSGTRGNSLAGRLVHPAIRLRLAGQIAISHHVYAAIEGPSTVVYPGVPEAGVCSTSSERTQTVLVAQRLEAEKGTDLALRAFALSRLADEGWLLRLAGDGAQRERLAELATELGIGESTEFLGHRRDVPDLMQTAGLLMATCEIEGLGLTAIEAMSCALPVVAVASGGYLETVGASASAALYPRQDESAASSLLRSLAGDAGLRDSYGADLHRVQQDLFTLTAQARATDDVYRRVL